MKTTWFAMSALASTLFGAACGTDHSCNYAQKIDALLTQGDSETYQFILTAGNLTGRYTMHPGDKQTITIPVPHSIEPSPPTRLCLMLAGINPFTYSGAIAPAGLTFRGFKSDDHDGTLTSLLFNTIGDAHCFDLTGSFAAVYEQACYQDGKQFIDPTRS